jgi:hypothetical protein
MVVAAEAVNDQDVVFAVPGLGRVLPVGYFSRTEVEGAADGTVFGGRHALIHLVRMGTDAAVPLKRAEPMHGLRREDKVPHLEVLLDTLH